MLGLFIVVTYVEQRLIVLPNTAGKKELYGSNPCLFSTSKRTPPAIKDLIVELSKKGKYVSEIIKWTNKPWSTRKKTLQKYWETGSTEGFHKGEICRFFE